MAHARGRLSLCPFEWLVVPWYPLLSLTCSLGSFAQKSRWTAGVSGDQAGSQAQLVQAGTPAPNLWVPPPPSAGGGTHTGIWVANDRSKLHRDSSRSCCPEPLPALTGPQTARGSCCCCLCGRQRGGAREATARPGAERGQGAPAPACSCPAPAQSCGWKARPWHQARRTVSSPVLALCLCICQ